MVQYILHTPVQYIHHTSPVHSIHQLNTTPAPVLYICHTRTCQVPTQLDLGFRISNTRIPKAKKFRALNNNQLVVKWCFGLQSDTSRGTSCALCPDVALDPLDHHAATCRHRGDIVVRHHKLCDVFLSYCLIAELEAGRCLTRGLDHTHLADV